MSKRFQGLGVALITPFTPEGNIDFPGLERMVHHVSTSKAHFLVALGSTGEAQLMSEEEQRRVLDFIVEVNAGRLPVVAGFSAAGGTRAAVDRIKALDVEGLAGLLISPPAYVKPGQAGMVAISRLWPGLPHCRSSCTMSRPGQVWTWRPQRSSNWPMPVPTWSD